MIDDWKRNESHQLSWSSETVSELTMGQWVMGQIGQQIWVGHVTGQYPWPVDPWNDPKSSLNEDGERDGASGKLLLLNKRRVTYMTPPYTVQNMVVS